MNKRLRFILGTFAAVVSLGMATAANVNGSVSTKKFEVGNSEFLLNGEPYVIKAAELHYPRIPRPYWDNRIKMTKALGMNTICIYVFWNVHESEPGKFDFTGNNDLQEFVKLCMANDMNVIVRPGPYVCAEWEMGGLPWWLLKEKDIRLRENDTYFLERVALFEEEVAKQIKDLTAENGGPIIMVQVENEYGAYGKNKEYIENIKDIIKDHYPETLLFQCDWSSNFLDNGLDDLLWTLNFGTGADIDNEFFELKKVRPDSPLMCSEYWSGWFDKWGANHETRPAEEMVDGIKQMLEKGISFSLYMTHGGTNWGHWAGANSPGYAPDVTSYDYDAPINENGQPTQKFWTLRKVMQQFEKDSLPTLPEFIPTFSIKRFRLDDYAPLFENLPKPLFETEIKTMEEYDQGFGSILYRTHYPEVQDSLTLIVDEAHDYAIIYLDGKGIGKLDRRLGETQITIPPQPNGGVLDIFVEATGRINFGRAIKDFKGIVRNVYLNYQKEGVDFYAYFNDWEVYLFPDKLDFYKSFNFTKLPEISNFEDDRIPGIYRGKFNFEGKPADTFLNFEKWGKGLVYVNGYPLGRIWNIGPQQTLYTPGVWLKEGENEIVIFDIIGPEETWVEGLTEPVLDKIQGNLSSSHKKENYKPNLMEEMLIAEFEGNNQPGWQQFNFEKPVKGRFLAIEIPSLFNPEDSVVSIAEFYIQDKNKNDLSREKWKVVYADSEDLNFNRTGDKIFDLQESTYWSSLPEDNFPHYLIIDLGEDIEASGMRYLPRVEPGNPGAPHKIRLYLSDNNFNEYIP